MCFVVGLFLVACVWCFPRRVGAVRGLDGRMRSFLSGRGGAARARTNEVNSLFLRSVQPVRRRRRAALDVAALGSYSLAGRWQTDLERCFGIAV